MNTKNLIVALALTTPLLFSCTRRDTTDVPVPTTDSTEATSPSNMNNNTMPPPDSTTYDATSTTNREVSSTTTGTAGTTDTTATNTTTRTRMGTGVTNSQLVQAQRALQARGYTVSSNDLGGPETTRALQQFQAEKDLQVTGALDVATLRALEILGTTDREPASVNDDVE